MNAVQVNDFQTVVRAGLPMNDAHAQTSEQRKSFWSIRSNGEHAIGVGFFHSKVSDLAAAR